MWKSDNNGRKVPELALETWSVCNSKIGWTLDKTKLTHYTFHTWHPSDCLTAFLLPFQLLRVAFARYRAPWERIYKPKKEPNKGWDSECMFVPVSVVLDAIRETSQGPLLIENMPPLPEGNVTQSRLFEIN